MSRIAHLFFQLTSSIQQWLHPTPKALPRVPIVLQCFQNTELFETADPEGVVITVLPSNQTDNRPFLLSVTEFGQRHHERLSLTITPEEFKGFGRRMVLILAKATPLADMTIVIRVHSLRTGERLITACLDRPVDARETALWLGEIYLRPEQQVWKFLVGGHGWEGGLERALKDSRLLHWDV